MRLMIIDDEKNIREGMRNYIASLALGFHEIVTCDSGVHALEVMEGAPPDVVVADILMPEMDGIETVERIYQTLPRVQVIIISGCNDFEYVRSSLAYPVVDYIPKPIQLTELRAALNRAIRKINEARQEAQSSLRTSRILSMLDQLREQFLRSVLLGAYSDTGVIRRNMEALELEGMALPGSMVAVAALRDEWTSDYSVGAASTLMRLANDSFPDETAVPMDETHLAIIFRPAPASERSARAARLEEAVFRMASDTAIQVSVGLSESVDGAEGLRAAYRQAYDAMQLARMRQNAVMLAGDASLSVNPQRFFIGEDVERRIRAAITNANPEMLRDLISRCMANMLSPEDPQSLWHAKLEAVRVYVTMLHALDDQSQTLLLSEIGALSAMKDASSVTEWFEQRLHILTDKGAQVRESRADCICRRMREEIDQNFAAQLSLQVFSDQTGLSANYLSQIFIQTTGVSFINYLTSRRMARAAELLRDPRTTVGAVAAEIGYDDPNYFTRLFRKFYGCSPTEYRKSDG